MAMRKTRIEGEVYSTGKRSHRARRAGRDAGEALVMGDYSPGTGRSQCVATSSDPANVAGRTR
jgi:hypothetical protein